jgi:hypothetical protein
VLGENRQSRINHLGRYLNGGNLMTRFVRPIYREAEFDAFRRAARPNLPNTYQEWLKLLADEVSEAERRGDTITQVEIHYDEFIAFCRTKGKEPDPGLLSDFTFQKTGLKNQ